MRLSWITKQGPLWWAIFLLALAPALYYWSLFLLDPRSLGVDSLEVVLEQMGKWALWLLLITLLCSPLARHTPIKAVRYRRMLGLFCFFYASTHLATYLIGWIELDWMVFIEDLGKRPFIYLGMLAWVGLLLLAVTSPKAMVRRLKKNWKRLHRLVYGVIVLALIHFWLQSRVSSFEAWLYTLMAVLLLGERLVVKLKARRLSKRPRQWSQTAA
ncbi:sulfite oxidase heme-binding subunit YedZ [Saccharospirillum mangrovi]|uniref:sulfite oxidase heme-binding subunit YedZ n=1 Tax=Saccharospirillum mangrovi TaxID=2161747 RepID=UPI000D38EA1C|nr:protein-methionine-sulfoxide reductase heme-binding subunit MsrQ [Saccharospirillum mangrovi]